MKKYTYKAYKMYGYSWDTKDFEITAENKQDAYTKAVNRHIYDEGVYPFVHVLKSSFRVSK